MKLLTRILVISFLLTCFIILIPNQSVEAANGLTLSPPLKEISIGPGLLETYTDISIENNSDQKLTAKLQLVDLKSLGQYGGTSLDRAGLTDKYDLANWMSLPAGDTVSIESKKKITVKVKIVNRSDLIAGGHYGAVIITASSDNKISSNVNITQQLVSLLFVKKIGGEQYGLELDSAKYEGKGIPQNITAIFKSTGNVHVIPRGYIEVIDPSGKQIAKGILNEDSNIILPGSSRQYVTNLQPVSTANKAGRYKIAIQYRYDGQEEFMTYETYFTYGSKFIQYAFLATGSGVVGISLMYLYLRFLRKHKPAFRRSRRL